MRLAFLFDQVLESLSASANPRILLEYADYADLFNKGAADVLPAHQEWDHRICYGFRSKRRSEKFHHVLELFMVIVDVWMHGLVGHNTW